MVSGKSASGKSASLQYIQDHPGVMYLNCENNKQLPFKNDFKQATVIDPFQVYDAFEAAEKMPEIHTIAIDTASFLMDMYETVHVLTATNTLEAWGQYAQYFKRLMSQYVAKSTKNVIFLAHTADVLNEAEMVNETMVKVKGSLMARGIESFFSTVISTKKMKLKDLEGYKSPLLNITDDDELIGIKYVFQTRLTKETVNERIRSPIGMWTRDETFIDNNITHVVNRLHEYYS